LVAAVVAFVFITSEAAEKPEKAKKTERASAKLPPCSACTQLVGSFEAGMEKTARGKLEGGDAAWEEKHQGSGYAKSEVRFVEIQERLCKDLDRGEIQCHDNHHHWEEHLEEWWSGEPEERAPLKEWLCVDKLKACCPEDHYGPDCTQCDLNDAKGRMCSGNGKCKGSGTRKGNGKCACDTGYGADLCDKCDAGFYNSYKDDEKYLCSACHKSCQIHCNGSGPKACAKCAAGYQRDTEHGCTDIDECTVSRPCTGNKFCVNTEGAFRCVRCDKSCDGCEGDGPDSCTECAEGHVKNKDGICITEQAAGRIFTISNTRFFTYIGLFVATAIIFQRSVVVAGVLGVVIALYITLSEYYLQGSSGELRPISAA
jgi:hypothetical protein